MIERTSLSAAYVAPVNEALAYRELLPLSGGSAPANSRVITSRAEIAVAEYLGGKVPEHGVLPPDLINRMFF